MTSGTVWKDMVTQVNMDKLHQKRATAVVSQTLKGYGDFRRKIKYTVTG